MKVIPLSGYSVTLYFEFYCFPPRMVGVAALSLASMVSVIPVPSVSGV